MEVILAEEDAYIYWLVNTFHYTIKYLSEDLSLDDEDLLYVLLEIEKNTSLSVSELLSVYTNAMSQTDHQNIARVIDRYRHLYVIM